MKTITTLILILTALTYSASSFACDTFSAVYRNRIGNEFKIISECDSLKIIDLNLGDVYQANSDRYQLQNQPTVTGRMIGAFGKFLPISARLGAINLNSRPVYIRFQLPSRLDQQESEITSPIIEIKFIMWWSPNSSQEVSFWLDSLRAVSHPNDGPLQKAFIQGVNLGLDLATQYSKTSFHEYLTRKR